MPEPTEQNNNQPQETPQPTGGEQSPVVSDQIDFSKLSDEQIVKVLEDQRIWKTERLAKLREQAKKAEEYEKARADEEQKKALEKGEHEKVITELNQKIADLESSIKEANINAQIKSVAAKLGVVDPEAALLLIDKSKVQIDDNGTVTGADEVITALLEEKPYLKGNGQAPNVGNPSNPGDGDENNNRRFKLSEIQDPKFYAENKDAINKALALNMIDTEA